MPFDVDIHLVGGPAVFCVKGLANGIADVLDAQPVLPAELSLHLVDNPSRPGHLVFVAGHEDLVPAVGDRDAESVADHAQIAIGRPEEGQSFVGLFKGDAEVHEGSERIKRMVRQAGGEDRWRTA